MMQMQVLVSVACFLISSPQESRSAIPSFILCSFMLQKIRDSAINCFLNMNPFPTQKSIFNMGIFLLKHSSFASLLFVRAETFSLLYICAFTLPFYLVSSKSFKKGLPYIVDRKWRHIMVQQNSILYTKNAIKNVKSNLPVKEKKGTDFQFLLI